MEVAIMWTLSVIWGLSSVAAQKAYVLDAPLRAPLPPALFVDVVNIWQALYDVYLIVQCVMHYGLELRLQNVLNVTEHMRCSKSWNWDFRFEPMLKGMRPPTRFFAGRMKENSSIVEHVLRLFGCYNHLNWVGVNLPDKIVINIVLQVTTTKLLELRDEL